MDILVPPAADQLWSNGLDKVFGRGMSFLDERVQELVDDHVAQVDRVDRKDVDAGEAQGVQTVHGEVDDQKDQQVGRESDRSDVVISHGFQKIDEGCWDSRAPPHLSRVERTRAFPEMRN